MLKVVIVNDASLARGGATGLSLQLARNLVDRGIETVFVAGDRTGNDDLAARGVRLYNAGADPLMKAPRHIAATRGLYSQPVKNLMAEVIRIEDSPNTIYHVHSWSKTLTPSVFQPLSMVASRVFIHAHDFFLACPNGGFMDYQAMKPCVRRPMSSACLSTNCDKRSYAQKMWRVTRQAILARTLSRNAPWAGILLIHPAMQAPLAGAGYPADRLITLRNPATALTDTRVTAENNDRILFIGRVEAEKGVEDAIAAAAAADVALTIVGDGPLRADLAQKHPNVRFTGWLDRADIATELQSARALVMPSRYPEPFGLVAAEASLSGVPVILSDTALLGAEVVAENLGYACDTRNIDTFSALLRRIASDDASDSIAQISKHGASGAAHLCTTPDEWVDAHLSRYARAIASAVRAA